MSDTWPPPLGEMRILRAGETDHLGRLLTEGPDLLAVLRARIDMPCGIHTMLMWAETRVTEEFLADAVDGREYIRRTLIDDMTWRAHDHGCYRCGKHCDCAICQHAMKAEAARKSANEARNS